MSEPSQLHLGDLGSEHGDHTPPLQSLPEPAKLRFQPLRAGLLNIWQYENQEFHFEDGRLILRGENGSGKSKALEVLLPFLLDANLSPQRLDPFQSQGRSMRWNLLEGGKNNIHRGYVWLEFGRRRTPQQGGGLEFITLGCGLYASQRSQGVDSWYFLVEGRRVGKDLSFAAGRDALTKKQLRQELEPSGTVFKNAGEYRQQVDRLLFQLEPQRYDGLLHLLLQLRRPHLSEKLDPGKLSALLGDSLPPIDEGLIGELAELFERLSQHEKRLESLRRSIGAVEDFLKVYGEYCRGVARAQAEEVSRSHQSHRRKSEVFRAVEEESKTLGKGIAGQEEWEQRLLSDGDRVRGEIRALENSEAMQEARTLRLREEHARTFEEQAARDEGDQARIEEEVGKAEQEHEAALGEWQKREAVLAEPTRRAVEISARVGLEAVHATAEALLKEDAVAHESAARKTVQAAARERLETVDEIRRLNAAHTEAEERFRRLEGRRREADEQVRAAHERERAAGDAARAEQEDVDGALVSWAAKCEELSLDEEELEHLRNTLLPDDERPSDEGLRLDLQSLLARQVEDRRDHLVVGRTAQERHLKELELERSNTAEERRRVEEARELGPTPPTTRAAEREGRAGAPLYLLCDFAPGLAGEERAGLEAALEASGLLDAWVHPEGHLLDAETLDTVLVPLPLVEWEGRTLADVLVASADSGAEVDAVAPEILERLLASVAVTVGLLNPRDEPLSAIQATVGLDGSWRLGPLHGRWAKPEPEHLGAAAREASRQRRLRELDHHLAELDALHTAAEKESAALERRLERLKADADEAPTTRDLERRRASWSAAMEDLARRREELTEAEKAVATARRKRDEARRHLEARAAELDLAAWLGQLESYRDLVRDYQAAFDDLARAHVLAHQAAQAAERTRTRRDALRERRNEVADRVTRSHRSAREARAEVTSLAATVGAEAREVIERHGLAVQRQEEIERTLGALRSELASHREQRAVLEERRQRLAEEFEGLDHERRQAAATLEKFVELGFLRLVTDEDFAADSWSLRHALETARAVLKQTADLDLSPTASDRRTNNLMRRYRELEGEIGGDFQPSLDRRDALLIFRLTHQQRDHSGPEFLDLLQNEVDERQGELAEEEREIMRRILLGAVGEHLRSRLQQANNLVRDVNGLLSGCRTASGMRLKLAWQPDEEVDSDVRQVLKLLRRDPELLSDDERQNLEDFFKRLTDEARQQQELVPWREHLLKALDYRAWHRFHIQRKMPGDVSWNRLTQRSHAASSGGEKAVALHLPLFAAAAAHYRSAQAEAPRLIMLDEAFAGIDQGMRGRCMALLVEFDLDFMMTSYDEWGCYSELPGVATYQLYRDPLVGGVAAIRFVWNGEELVEEDP